MMEIDRALADAGLGSLRDGVEARLRGTIGVDERGSRVRLSLLEVDPAFTAGRMALDRAEVIRRMIADGSLHANRSLEIPLVPLRIGLVTSRGPDGLAPREVGGSEGGPRGSAMAASPDSLAGDRGRQPGAGNAPAGVPAAKEWLR